MLYSKKTTWCVGKMSKKKNSRKRKGTNRIYFFFVFAFVFIVMAIQITSLVKKNAYYAAEEARLEKEKEYSFSTRYKGKITKFIVSFILLIVMITHKVILCLQN